MYTETVHKYSDFLQPLSPKDGEEAERIVAKQKYLRKDLSPQLRTPKLKQRQ